MTAGTTTTAPFIGPVAAPATVSAAAPAGQRRGPGPSPTTKATSRLTPVRKAVVTTGARRAKSVGHDDPPPDPPGRALTLPPTAPARRLDHRSGRRAAVRAGPVTHSAVRSARLVLRRGLAVGAVVLLVALVWAALALLRARGDLADAEAALRRASTAEGLDDARRDLTTAQRALRRADARLSAPGPALAARVPLLGRTPDDTARRATAAALAVAVAGGDVLDALQDGDPVVQDGRLDPAGLERVSRALRRAADRTQSPVSELADAPTTLVPRVLAEGGARREGAGGRRAAAAARGRARGAGAARAGRRRRRAPLLVLLQNNAELRGTGGLVTSSPRPTPARRRGAAGVPRRRGRRRRSPAARGASRPARLPSASGAPFLADTTLWKNVNMTPDVPTWSQVLAAVAAVSLPPAGRVIWLDMRAIAAVLGATAPASLPDGTVLAGTTAVERCSRTPTREPATTRAARACAGQALRPRPTPSWSGC